MKLAFTGHRPNKLGGFQPNPTRTLIKSRIRELLRDLRPEMVFSGLALGLDTWVADICVAVGQPWTACVPFENQDSMWPAESRRHYRWLRQNASKVLVLSEGGYAPAKMRKRNTWMVDHSDVLAAFWDGSSGGTANCVGYAREHGKFILRASAPDWTPTESR